MVSRLYNINRAVLQLCMSRKYEVLIQYLFSDGILNEDGVKLFYIKVMLSIVFIACL